MWRCVEICGDTHLTWARMIDEELLTRPGAKNVMMTTSRFGQRAMIGKERLSLLTAESQWFSHAAA